MKTKILLRQSSSCNFTLFRINNPLLDDEPFYHTCIALFYIMISATTINKVKNIAHVTPSIIHKTQQLNIQSSGLKPVKLFYPVRNVDRNNVSHEFHVANIY